MKYIMKKTVVLITMAAFLFMGCDVDKKGDVELPEVDVDVDAEAGNLPEFDVDWADVDVSTTTKTVEVPKVVVVMEEEEIEVPTINVNMPDEDNEERTIRAEVEISGVEHDLEIKEVRADERRLYVIAELEKLDTDLGDKTLRVQDQLELNAPDLDVQYIIVGEKPDRIYNNQNRFVTSMANLPERVRNAKVIYNR